MRDRPELKCPLKSKWNSDFLKWIPKFSVTIVSGTDLLWWNTTGWRLPYFHFWKSGTIFENTDEAVSVEVLQTKFEMFFCMRCLLFLAQKYANIWSFWEASVSFWEFYIIHSISRRCIKYQNRVLDREILYFKYTNTAKSTEKKGWIIFKINVWLDENRPLKCFICNISL